MLHRSSDTAQAIRAFIATYDRNDVSDREIAARIREKLHSELYRRERESWNAPFVDLGGEGGEA